MLLLSTIMFFSLFAAFLTTNTPLMSVSVTLRVGENSFTEEVRVAERASVLNVIKEFLNSYARSYELSNDGVRCVSTYCESWSADNSSKWSWLIYVNNELIVDASKEVRSGDEVLLSYEEVGLDRLV